MVKFIIPRQLLISRPIGCPLKILKPFYNQKCYSMLTLDLLILRRTA